MQILHAARPIDDWLASTELSAPQRQRLQTARRMREFAISHLALPSNASYTRYANLQREYVVWNVVAAPVDSLDLHRWCFPIAGCVGYRGYFSPEDAREEAARLAAQGWEVGTYGVPAYSTLGWLNWLGGDPLLNTFLDWPEGEFAGLLFHELAHQLVYAPGDTGFNESFATAVERLATPLWLQTQAGTAARQQWQKSLLRKQQWRDLTRMTRAQLQAVYDTAGRQAAPDPVPTLASRKRQVLAEFQARYAQLRAQWLQQDEALLATEPRRSQYLRGLAQTDEWVAKANNASFGALAAYDDWVPAFVEIWNQSQRDAAGHAPSASPSPHGWQVFYERVKDLAGLEPGPREQELCRHLPAGSHQPAACKEARSMKRL